MQQWLRYGEQVATSLSREEDMMRSALLAFSVVALGGVLLCSSAHQSAHAQVLGGLKASAADSGNLVTLVRRGGGGRGGISRGGGGRGSIARGGGGRGGHIARGGGGRAMHAYRGGGRAMHAYRGGGGRAHVSHPIRGGGRYAGNIGRYHGDYGNRYYGRYYGNRYYGNRYYGRRYGYWPWIGVGAGAYYYGSTNCDWLYRHNYRRWLAVCQ